MKILAAENHSNWQVEVGYHRASNFGGDPLWSTSGFGCVVHPRIVLTSSDVWQKTAERRPYEGEAMVRIGETDYVCTLGHEDQKRNLALLVTAEPLADAEGNRFKNFPAVPDTRSKPGQ